MLSPSKPNINHLPIPTAAAVSSMVSYRTLSVWVVNDCAPSMMALCLKDIVAGTIPPYSLNKMLSLDELLQINNTQARDQIKCVSIVIFYK